MTYQFKDVFRALDFYNKVPMAKLDEKQVTFPKMYQELAIKMGGTRVHKRTKEETT